VGERPPLDEMLSFTFGLPPRGPLAVLCLGAHSDDIEIGCGGTLLRLLAERRRVMLHWVVLSGDRRRAQEARRSATRLARGAAGLDIEVAEFRDGFFPFQGAELKDRFEQLKRRADPDLVFTHRGDDAHQDHRMVSELTWNTFRDYCILEYEIPKYDGDLGRPSVFVPLSPAIRRRKVRHLMTSFPSQRRKHWYSASTFDGLMRIRGVECAAPEGYAEAFHARKLLIAPSSTR
jgi:LmbE family N-acetylglucosaminyl deacetylase